MADDNVKFELEQAQDGSAVNALIAQAFGPGRFAKTAERLREGRQAVPGLSYVARQGGGIVGCVLLWPIRIGETPALFLGPFAVDAGHRDKGLGIALIRHACDGAAAAGHRLVLLIGDAPYFARAGFEVAKGVIMPGPVDPRRTLLRALRDGASLGVEGFVSPDNRKASLEVTVRGPKP